MKRTQWVLLLMYLLLLWLGIGHIVYAFRNPDMTTTRRLLNTREALLFQP